MDSMLTFDVNSVRKAYMIFIPLGLFWTTYRAWKEENDAKIQAQKNTPEALLIEISQLREKLEPRELTDQQAAILESSFREISIDWSLELCFNPGNTEAEYYARQFWERLRGLVFLTATNEVPIGLSGVGVSVKDLANIPERARKLSAALASAGIKHEFMVRPQPYLGTIRDDYCDITIGRKPVAT